MNRSALYRRRLIWLSVLVLPLLAGCGEQSKRPRIEGKVTYKGQPIADQTLVLQSDAAPGETAIARLLLSPDGTFIGDVPAPGKYLVAVEGSLAATEGKRDRMVIPEKYRSAATSQLTWDIQTGQNKRDFELAD